MRLPASLDSILDAGGSSPVTPRNEPHDGQPQDIPKGPRIAYSVVSIFCMLLLATMLGETHVNLHGLTPPTCASLTVFRFAHPHFHGPQTRETSRFHQDSCLPALHLCHFIRRHCCDSAIWSRSQHSAFMPRSHLHLLGVLCWQQSTGPALSRGKGTCCPVQAQAAPARLCVAGFSRYNRTRLRYHRRRGVCVSFCRDWGGLQV